MLVPQYLSEYPQGQEGNAKQIREGRIEEFFADSVDAGMDDIELNYRIEPNRSSLRI